MFIAQHALQRTVERADDPVEQLRRVSCKSHPVGSVTRMRAAPPGYSDRTEFLVRGTRRRSARQVGQETSVDVVLFAGMQQLAEILNGMADVVERVVHIHPARAPGMADRGELPPVVDRDVSVDDM